MYANVIMDRYAIVVVSLRWLEMFCCVCMIRYVFGIIFY